MGKINRVNFRDVQALNGLRICGYAARDDLLKIITSNRIEKMIKQGIIETKVNIKNEPIYTYTDKGRTFIKNLDGIKSNSFYSRQGSSTEHDTKLFSEYCNLTPNERMSCLTERQTRDYFNETFNRNQGTEEIEKLYSVPDLVYITEMGITTAIEIITENYNEQRIEMKENFCETAHIELRMVRI